MKKIFVILLLTVPAFAATSRNKWVERTLKSMSLDEKIGQMLVPGIPNGGFRSAGSVDFETARENIERYHVGSYHTFGGDPASVALFINALQKMSKLPLLITADFEGGPGYTMFGATRLPRAMTIGATGDPQLAYEAGKLTAQEGRAIGVGVNFYPVADVQDNPRNPIINVRSFGEDPARVSTFVRAYIRGAQENGQIATAKHFPGHGDVFIDSHLEMPMLDLNRARLDAVELPPFKAAVAEGVGAVMTSHIWMMQIEPEHGVPSTLSKNVISSILRGEMHYDGLVFTDSMVMGAITKNFTNEDATLRAVEAGVDCILLPPDVGASFNAIRNAVQSGRIAEAKIDDAVRRILTAKACLGLDKNRFTDPSRLLESVGTKEHLDLAQKIADGAITLVRDQQHVLPLKPSPDTRVAQIDILDTRTGWREGPVGRVLAAEMQKRFPRAVTVQVDDQSQSNEFDIVRKLAQTCDVILVNGFIRVAAYKGSIDLTPDEMRLLQDLMEMKKPFVFTIFGSPYLLTQIPALPSYIVAYDIGAVNELAAVKAITGEIPFRGRLPINLPELYKIGDGITTAAP